MKLFPYTLFALTGRFIKRREVARMISRDQHLFSSFFSMALKTVMANDGGMKVDPAIRSLISQISSIDSKTFSINELESSSKIAESIKNKLGQYVTAEYLGKFLAFADLYHRLQTQVKGRELIEDAVWSIGEMMIETAKSVRIGTTDGFTNIEANIAEVSNLYRLEEIEMILLEHATLVSIDQDAFIFYKLFDMACPPGQFGGFIEMAFVDIARYDLLEQAAAREAMDAAERVLSHRTSTPLAFSIVKKTPGHQVGQLSQFWSKVMTYNHEDGDEGFTRLFVTPIKANKSYSSVIARLNERMIPLFKDLVDKAIVAAPTPQAGVNVLFYGPRSLDKLQAFQRALAGIEYTLYETNIPDSGWGDEASITWAAQQILEKLSEDDKTVNILLVRDASKVLSRGHKMMSFSSFFSEEGAEPPPDTELDSDEMLLTKSMTPTFWFSTDATQLSAEAIGKFMMHLEVIPGTRADRKLEVEKIADSLNLPPEVRQALSKYMQLGASQVETAARVIDLLVLEAPNSYETLLLLVHESQKALGRDKIEEIRTSVTKYDLGLLNIQGKFTPEQVIEALKKKKTATMCFYGMPGTGKTQLAEYIADKLDMPLLVKRASDIMSKWVGDNEKNIAAMFKEAEAEGAVLLLDEADSFLRDRALSKNNWEVTMVNELLQGMERFKGIFICASNLFNQLDAAALRRFTFKFNFLELSETQRIKMFTNEAGVNPEVGTELYDNLMMIRHLTPGDFATVKRQANLFDTTLTPDDWLKQLAEEAKAKHAGMQRNEFNTELM